MNISIFTEHKTGEILPIKVDTQNDHAFLPAKLPPNWRFPERLWPLLADARDVLGRLGGIGRSLPDTTLLVTPLRRREALTSSALEGTYATPEQLVLFEMGGKESRSSPENRNEWREVSNYHTALNRGVELLKEIPFCRRLFQELHTTLLDGLPIRYRNPGIFREHQVAIGSDRRYIPPPVDHLDKCLNDLEAFINAETPEYDPLVKAYLVHYQFEAIHPFYDGNGRIGRVLLSLMISKWRKESEPWLYMSAFFERFKDEYITNMFNVSARGDWEKWIEFCLRGTIRQANDSVRRCDQLKVLQSEFLGRISGNCTKRTHRIVNGLFREPIIFQSRLQEEFGITAPTARAELESLVSCGILRKLDGMRPATYSASEIFGIAFGTAEEDLV